MAMCVRALHQRRDHRDRQSCWRGEDLVRSKRPEAPFGVRALMLEEPAVFTRSGPALFDLDRVDVTPHLGLSEGGGQTILRAHAVQPRASTRCGGEALKRK